MIALPCQFQRHNLLPLVLIYSLTSLKSICFRQCFCGHCHDSFIKNNYTDLIEYITILLKNLNENDINDKQIEPKICLKGLEIINNIYSSSSVISEFTFLLKYFTIYLGYLIKLLLFIFLTIFLGLFFKVWNTKSFNIPWIFDS